MKRLLFISTADLGKRTGGGLASLAYYNALCQFCPNLVDLMMPVEYCENKYPNAIGVPKRSLRESIISGSIHRYKNFLKNYLSQKSSMYEVCIINGGLYAGDMMDMIHDFGLKVIVIHHNFEREYHLDNRSILTLWGLTPFFVVKNEKKAYLSSDCNCFLTLADVKAFESYYGKTASRSFVIGVFEPYNVDMPKVVEEKINSIVITGSMNSVQTMRGIKDLRENYYRIIQKNCPGWTLRIAGRDPQQEVYKLKDCNPEYIEIIPNPVNINDVTKGASIFLCPTNVGGGLKLRLMDGLRQGIPVLVHKISARGYESFYGEPFFKVYEDKNTFEDGLKLLLQYCNDSFDRHNIQEIYAKKFDFNSGCFRIKEVLDYILCN